MFFWLIYLLVCLYISYILSNLFGNKFRLPLFLFFTVVLMTPATVDAGSNHLAPSIFIFFYDLIFEQNFSFRSLRPILLSVPSSYLVLVIILYIRKKLF